jgi:hypothetical protein
MKLFSSIRYALAGLVVGVGSLMCSHSAIAADTIVFRYGAVSETFSVQELTEFAQTGRQSSTISYYLRRTNQQPEAVRTAISREIPVRLVTLDRVLNSPVGDFALDRIGRTIQTPVNTSNRQALRAALVLSASTDNRISLIEVFQNYPTRQLNVDGRELISTYTQISELAQRIQNLPDIFRVN